MIGYIFHTLSVNAISLCAACILKVTLWRRKHFQTVFVPHCCALEKLIKSESLARYHDFPTPALYQSTSKAGKRVLNWHTHSTRLFWKRQSVVGVHTHAGGADVDRDNAIGNLWESIGMRRIRFISPTASLGGARAKWRERHGRTEAKRAERVIYFVCCNMKTYLL